MRIPLEPNYLTNIPKSIRISHYDRNKRPTKSHVFPIQYDENMNLSREKIEQKDKLTYPIIDTRFDARNRIKSRTRC